MKIEESETLQNLVNAFAGESQARNKYTYFASKAKKEGYEQIAAIFEETANQEKELGAALVADAERQRAEAAKTADEDDE